MANPKFKILIDTTTGKPDNAVADTPERIASRPADIASGKLVECEYPQDVLLDDLTYDPATKTLVEDATKKAKKQARKLLMKDVKNANTVAKLQAVLVALVEELKLDKD